MSDWIGNIISGIALGVSGLSLFISIRTAQRAINAAKVTAWIDPLQRTGSSEWLLATLNVKNPSHTDIKVEKVGIDLPDFRVGDSPAAPTIGSGAICAITMARCRVTTADGE